jgi:hypothetical protein
MIMKNDKFLETLKMSKICFATSELPPDFKKHFIWNFVGNEILYFQNKETEYLQKMICNILQKKFNQYL